MDSDQARKWRKAHPELDVADAGLATMADCASLYASDYANYLESQGSGENARFVRSLLRETEWAYGNWQKAQRDGVPKRLLADLLNNARGGPTSDVITKFLRDYMQANNIPDDSGQGMPELDFRSLPGMKESGADVPPRD